VENDEYVINLKIADKMYSMKIKRGDEQEYWIRKAAKRVDQYVNEYRAHFAKSVENRDLLAMIAVQLANHADHWEERNDTEPFTRKIQQLTEMLDDYLTDK